MEAFETWQGKSITAAAAKRAIVDALSQKSQSQGGNTDLGALTEYISEMPDGHERLRDLAHWCIVDGMFSLGPEADRYVNQFSGGESRNAFDLLLSQVISAQKRLNGRTASEIKRD